MPKIALEKDILYLRPKKLKPSDPDKPWYENSPVGKNTLRNMVKNMCADIGISGKTNHSLRATGETALFQNNVPEGTIQKVIGHRSLEALRNYETISIDQHKEVSRILVSDVSSEINGAASTGVLGGIHSCSSGNLTISIAQNINI